MYKEVSGTVLNAVNIFNSPNLIANCFKKQFTIEEKK